MKMNVHPLASYSTLQSIYQSTSQSINQSINQTINHSINQSITWSINQSLDQSINPSTRHSNISSPPREPVVTRAPLAIDTGLPDHTYPSTISTWCTIERRYRGREGGQEPIHIAKAKTSWWWKGFNARVSIGKRQTSDSAWIDTDWEVRSDRHANESHTN